MITGDLRSIGHVGDTVQHVEIIISVIVPQCLHVMTHSNRLTLDRDAPGDVEIRTPLTEASSPPGWYVVPAWYAPC